MKTGFDQPVKYGRGLRQFSINKKLTFPAKWKVKSSDN
jgi:hypothetical protein